MRPARAAGTRRRPTSRRTARIQKKRDSHGQRRVLLPQHARKSAYPSGTRHRPTAPDECRWAAVAGRRGHDRRHAAPHTAYSATPPCANPYNEHLRSNGVLDVLIGLVIATFIIAGAYVGYHYSQDPGNFASHDAEMPHAAQALSASHHAGNDVAPAFYAPALGERVAGAAL